MKFRSIYIWIAPILIGIELIIFLILHFTINKIVNQSIFGVFLAFWLIILLWSIIAINRSSIVIKNSKDAIEYIGHEKIHKYYGSVKKITEEELIRIKTAENIKFFIITLLSSSVTFILCLLAFLL